MSYRILRMSKYHNTRIMQFSVFFFFFFFFFFFLFTINFSYLCDRFCSSICITKTCLYNFDPLKPHFYIVKLGFTGVYIILIISAQKIDCGYSLEPPLQGGSNEYPQSMFWAEIWKIFEFFVWKFSIFRWLTFQYIWIGVFGLEQF